ncbi:MAG: hypothetical protein KC912_14360 [Proteobacteria bacterium]|nr:hypothetical protein [Pseudomonadota bacterium]
MRLFTLALALVLGSTAVAGGIMGGDAPSRIPIPAEEFSASVEDTSGTIVSVERVTYNGEVFLYGNLGEAQVTIPFERISEVRVEPHPDKDKVTVMAVLKDADPVTITAEHDMPCYGATPFGNYKIEIEKVRRIAFP